MSQGRLSVKVGSDSYFLGSNLPWEVRDASHRLVESKSGGRTMELPAGLYTVEAVLPDGERESQVVQIVADRDSVVNFGIEPPTGTTRSLSFSPGPGKGRARRSTNASPNLVETIECEATQTGRGTWTFAPRSSHLSHTPVARFDTGKGRVAVSLPLNPRGSGADRCCKVQAFEVRGEVCFETRFDPTRRVATVVQGMLRSGGVVRGARVLEEASELLLYKYQDPAAAALGGLTLHRLGHLEQRQDWVENLARDFRWISDGRILLASLLAAHPEDRDRGYRELIEASQQRQLYTDGLSLLLELLRRWPDPATWRERKERLDAIALRASRLDWNALALTESEEG